MRSVSLSALPLLVVVALLGAACQTEPVYNVDRAIVPEEPDWDLTDMTRAIQRAGARRGWDMRIVEPGRIEGRLRKPAVVAIVEVTYTASEFSIHYADSENLDYTGDRIHSSYNRWVYNLEGDIRREFLRMRPTELHVPGGAGVCALCAAQTAEQEGERGVKRPRRRSE